MYVVVVILDNYRSMKKKPMNGVDLWWLFVEHLKNGGECLLLSFLIRCCWLVVQSAG